MSKPKTLRFGIQSLDKLIGTIREGIYGIDLSEPPKISKGRTRSPVAPPGAKPADPDDSPITSSVCLTGPDGTGKSVFSLHIASRYLADCLVEPDRHKLSTSHKTSDPKVLYISTDLTYGMALKAWENFALDRPSQRRERLIELRAGRREEEGRSIKLKQYFPSGDDNSGQNSIVNYMEGIPSEPEVCFVDLASRTAGDDWGFVHRLLSTLEEPGKNQPRHLVVLDAIEGFETLVGDLNAFGEESTRRSRIAQVMRLATAKCHLVFVVEEGRNQRFPEEFVTDVVIRLRNIEVGRYLRRTVEIEKARGQSHVRGQHPFVIRDGKGSTTGNQENADEPEVLKYDSDKGHQSYVHVFSSLHLISRTRMIDKYNPREHSPDERFAAFGIQYLDNMLGGTGEKALALEDGSDTRGLPCGWATALIGDSLTQKTQLGMAFLSRAFYPFAKALAESIVEAAKGSGEIERYKERMAETRKKLKPVSVENQQATVMFTTRVIDHDELADHFYEWLEGSEAIKALLGSDRLKKQIFETELKKYIRQYAICRRFEIHDISAPVLMHIFQRNIEKAQRTVLGLEEHLRLPGQEKLFKSSWRVRVVIDDLKSFRDTFPEMRDDPLMLPSLLSMLGKEGVTTLIIDTQTSGSPELPITERFDSSVRQLVKNRIYAWRFPFYGENRVAISIIPPISPDYRGVIRELRWETKDERRPTRDERKTDRSLTVDPHLELYAGLERGQPQPVPLEVRLYAETPSFKKYIETEERFFREVFTPVLAPGGPEEPRVIKWGEASEYDALRDSCHLQSDTRIDHTTILQVDEFWWLRRARQHRAGAFRQQWNYLGAVTARGKLKEGFQRDLVADPFEVFQPPPLPKPKQSEKLQDSSQEPMSAPPPPNPPPVTEFHRFNCFDPECGYDLDRKGNSAIRAREEQYIDRVPFTWDFGFLLCNGKAWEEAFGLEIERPDAKGKAKRKGAKTVKDVWDALRTATPGSSQSKSSVTWREFLAASKVVAEFQSYRTSTPATTFDFTMLMPESFSCLILEMWLSEALNSLAKHEKRCGDAELRKKLKGKRAHIIQRVRKRRWRWDKNLEARNLLIVLQNEKGKHLTKILKKRQTGEVNGYSLELYKVWLLLIESLNFAGLVDSSSHLNFEFKSKDVGAQAVSARHWYKTASKFMDSLTPEQLEYNWVPVRLPGHFSVRADWFLAVAGGSRSNRLADHALDLLSSQRANITRLQEGIGLPTRILTKDENKGISRLRTRLISSQQHEPVTNIEYESLRRIGARNDAKTSKGEDFYWLWRSGIWAYNRHSRVWQKWLNRTLLWWHSLRQRHGSNWTSSFDLYDILNDIEFSNDKKLVEGRWRELERLNLTSWKEFNDLRDILIAELEQVSISTRA